MTATYNLHNIMTDAWTLYRKFSANVCSVPYTFSTALKEAWRRAKAATIDHNAIYTITLGNNTILLNLKTGYITGDTYQMRSIIKSDLSAKWSPDTKAWYNGSLGEVVEQCKERLIRVYNLRAQSDLNAAAKEAKSHRVRNAFRALAYDTSKPCPRCGSWCYGECSLYPW